MSIQPKLQKDTTIKELNAPAMKDQEVSLHLQGIKDESNRVKDTLDKHFKRLVDDFNKEVNIATRYELKLRITEVQDIYRELFMKGE